MRIFFFRHGPKHADFNTLSQEGRSLVQDAGRRHLPGVLFNAVFTSRNGEALSSAPLLIKQSSGTLDKVERVSLSASLYALDESAWPEHLKANPGRLNPTHPFIAEEAKRMRTALLEDIKTLPRSSQVLAVGQSNLLEVLIHALTDVVVRPLGECEGAIVDFRFSEFVFIKELRNP